MKMYDLIMKKKRGEELTKDEIKYMITNYTNGTIPDYQMSAMMMAVCFQGMMPEETKNLTIAMAESGDMLDLSEIKGIKVDNTEKGLKIDVNIIVEYGDRIPDVAYEIQNRVKKAIEDMTGLNIDEVNVHIQGVNIDIQKNQSV